MNPISGHTSSDAPDPDLEALRSRVTVFEPGIVRILEVPVISRHSIDIMFDRYDELAAKMPEPNVIVDMSSSAEPTADVRAHLRTRIASCRSGHVAMVTGRNAMMNIAVKFIVGRLVSSVSFHKTFEQALERIRAFGARR